MKKKIFVRGPVLSQSGYGEQARFALRALRSREDLFDIYIQPIKWGETGWVWEDNEFRRWMDQRITETAIAGQNKTLAPDMSLQITIPNEWEKIAPINIGYTAGIETSHVAPQWLQKGNEMDKILVVSEHAKQTFVDTVATAKNEDTGEETPYRLSVPVDVVHERTVAVEPEPIEGFDLPNRFNFLMVSQMGPRKNMENAVRWWVEEFIDQKVGLVIKTAFRGNSEMDREFTHSYLKKLLEAYPKRKCKVHLLHGDLSNKQMAWLYRHQKIKCFVNIAHGEGFGLPIFEAAEAALPIITIAWSGQKDIIQHGKTQHFTPVNFVLQPIQKQAEWPGVLEPGTQWAFADQGSYKLALRKVKKNYNPAKKKATQLQKLVKEKFDKDKLYQGFIDGILGKSKEAPSPVKSISFCISTNGAKIDKTLKEIKSIKATMQEVDTPYEIILAGDVEVFSDDESLVLVKTPEDAHNGLLAKLRNNAAEKASNDVLVFVDDDFIFPKTWAKRLIEYSKETAWKVTANKIWLPDGSRFWDRATMFPHQLVSYDHPQYDKKLYQTGGFWIMRKEVYANYKWNSNIPINFDKTGQGPNEDIEMSIRMHHAGINLSFDKDNLVWHCDDNYAEFQNQTLKKELILERFGEDLPTVVSKEYQQELASLD